MIFKFKPCKEIPNFEELAAHYKVNKFYGQFIEDFGICPILSPSDWAKLKLLGSRGSPPIFSVFLVVYPCAENSATICKDKDTEV